MNLTDDQAKKYLEEIRKYAAVASNSASAASRVERDIKSVVDTAAAAAMSERMRSLQVVSAEPGEAASWDNDSNTLTLPRGNDGASITIRTATAANVEDIKAQYPNDLIVVMA